jgi:hypothetical protein
MKKNAPFLLFIAFLCFANALFAQNNRKTFNFDNKKSQTISTVQETQLSKIDGKNGESHIIAHKPVRNSPSLTKANHQFKLNILGEWWIMFIADGIDFFDVHFGGEAPYIGYLPEGYFDIIVCGYSSDDNPAYYFLDQVHVFEPTELTADMADATHKIDIAPVDANNTSLYDLKLFDTEISYTVEMHYSIKATMQSSYSNWEEGFWPGLYLYTNDMGSRNKIFITADGYDPVNCSNYSIAFPLIENGITGDVMLTNNSEEVHHFSQMPNYCKDIKEDPYPNRGTFMIHYDFETGLHGWMLSSQWSSFRVQDKEKPYSLYSNYKFKENPQSGDLNAFIVPVFYDFFDIYGQTDYQGLVAYFPMGVNKNNELIVDFFSLFREFPFVSPKDIELSICNNPLSRVYDKEELYYEGFRTPHLCHLPVNINAQDSPYGVAYVMNRLVYIGENGEQKYNHGDLIVNIKCDGVEVYKDSLFMLNDTYMTPAAGSQYQIELINDQVFAYGKKMINRTTIDFDVTKTDVNPPTITMLRVINREDISMVVTDESARLEIAAADFTYDITVDGIIYNGKPNIEVSFSIDGTNYYELTVEEDVSKFHPQYGNFFNVSLKPVFAINSIFSWVTIKVVLTDDAGNKQEQIFEPLFHFGTLGIEEISPNQLSSVAYPVPFEDIVNIELQNPVSGEHYFEVYDISGKIIHQQKYNCEQTRTFRWNGSHLNAGIYFYGIYGKEGVVKGKLLKQ